jgi:ribosomal protein S15P/S13E
VNAMLLNEFLKEHRKVEELEKQIKALSAIVQKVNKHVELNKRDSQLVASDF